jgi:Uma2 family endonuclease
MATNVLVPVSEYLRTSYEPDCDYVDGELQERNVGELDHSDLQSQLLELLRTAENKRHIRANSELRIQVKPNRFRVPDVCVRPLAVAKEKVLRQPPLLCIEVLSPEDRMSRTLEKVRDYLEMGVPEVWVFDPETRSVLICKGATAVTQTEGTITIPETPVTLKLADIFSALDNY